MNTDRAALIVWAKKESALWRDGVPEDEANGRVVGAEYGTRMADHFDAIASLLEAEAWQPISTAPKDGTRLHLYGYSHKRHWFGFGYYFKGVPGDGEGWIAHSSYTQPDNDATGSFEPAHWRPLPAPPVTEAKP